MDCFGSSSSWLVNSKVLLPVFQRPWVVRVSVRFVVSISEKMYKHDGRRCVDFVQRELGESRLEISSRGS